MEKVNLSRQVFDKDKFGKTVDTTFTQLGSQQPDLSFFDINLATIEDFFNLYNKFFLLIPKEGNINSHRYLYNESGQYINAQEINEQLTALMAEIVDLREENLSLKKTNNDYISEISLYDVNFLQNYETSGSLAITKPPTTN